MFNIFATIIDNLNKNITVHKEKARKIIGNLDLPIGRTVILAPYSRSIARAGLFNDEWWYEIRDRLVKKGFTVVTNVGPGEEPIPSAVALRVSFDEVIPIAEYAGWVIGIRSGLFDILSSASCKLTILYPRGRQKRLTPWQKNSIDIHSLKYILGNKENLNEFEMGEFPTPYVVDEITRL